MTNTAPLLSELYLEDETAWLDAMAELIASGAYAELDYSNLREYLTDMAIRDRREVESRLFVLMMHILKWVHQPGHRSGSWKGSIIVQRAELKRHAGRGVLRKHAESVLADVYQESVEAAAEETGLPLETFPSECPYTFDDVLTFKTDAAD